MRRTLRQQGATAVAVGCSGLAALLAACSSTSQPVAAPTQPAAQAPTQQAPVATAPPAIPAPAGSAAPAAGGGVITLNGAGSTFDAPLFSTLFDKYSTDHPSVRVNYQSVGSGAGIQQLTENTVDFGATDAPLTDDQMAAAKNDVVHIPVTLGASSVAYNLPGVQEGLKLSGSVLGDIYLGNIKTWNDSRITDLNPGVQLPNTDISVVYRSDGSGTTDIFTTYLASVSPAWESQVGSGLSVNFPTGIGGKGSEGVAGQVKQVPGSIGYFELSYAKQNNLTSAAIATGDAYLLPSVDGATACAAAAAANLPADLRVRIAGCSGSNAYPISGFSWMVMHQAQTDASRGQALVNLAWWTVHTGQQYGPDLFYAPLPDQAVKADEAKLQAITAGGQTLKPQP